ncbi:MAG TPA: DUF885 domain-containing protein [Woeseiaceae bacterium]|nr:DUF885 domain-containing protein [Woeseiaceae bacterium]
MPRLPGKACARLVAHAAAVACLLPAAANSESDADRAFEILGEKYLTDIPDFSPVAATQIGDHSADDRLDEVDARARDREADLYVEYRKALDAIEFDDLSRANQVDARLLTHEIESGYWQLTELEEWAWNPLVYTNIAGNAVYALVARDFAPVDVRLRNAAARLEQLPRFFAQSRAALSPARVPRVHAETAVSQNSGLKSIIDLMIVPAMAELLEEDRARLTAAIETANAAIDEQQAWLENDLLPNAAGDFRIGAALYDRKLAFALNSPLGRREVQARAESEYQRVRNEMYTLAREVYARQHPYTTFPDNPDEAFKQAIVRAALEQAYRRLPPADGIVEAAEAALEQASDFVVEHNIVEMPAEPVEIIVMPEFQRGVSVAYLDPPGPLDEGQSAFYAVAPLPSDWTPEQVESFLREYNFYSIHDLTLHEGVPGHYLQLAHSNRYPSTLRAVLWSGPFVEGWAVYAERMMIDEGYLGNDPLMRLVNLKWYLRSITNAIIDSAIHVDGMTEEQAMKLMIEGGFQEEREAAGKWRRAQLTSAQLSTYFVGYQEHAAMREAVERAWGDDFTLRRYHDTALSFGSPPVRFVRALILDEPIPD